MNKKLANALNNPMKHISDVRRCFNLCSTQEDVKEVIGSIPAKFGNFNVEFSDDGETFVISNSFYEEGEYYEEEAEYEFYEFDEEG